MKSQNDMLAYLNAANYAEISKGFNLRGQLYKKNFQEFVAKQTEHMTKVNEIQILLKSNINFSYIQNGQK